MDAAMRRNLRTLKRLRRRTSIKVHPLAAKKDDDGGLRATNEVLWVFTDELIALIREVGELRQRVKRLER